MTEQLINAVAMPPEASTAASLQQVEAGYGVSLTDISAFQQSLSSASARVEAGQGVAEASEAEKAVAKPLDYINTEAAEIVDYARSAVESGNELSPSEIVMLTARSHEFMFHCQLTANVANRTSEGLQQLFRQQS